ncbi:MAG TPA: VWA domain-containing protein, partial [Terriglobales bacterium]|nr:VWA domain-containing protein [Terriglobales bacterium]
MHPRNRVISKVVAGFFLTILLIFGQSALSQTTTAPAQSGPSSQNPSQPPSNAPPGQSPTTPAAPQTQAPTAPNTPQGQTGSSAPAPSNQAPAQSGAPGAQAPAQSQGTSPDANDNGIFVFKAEAKEVVLHATVIDERNHLVMNLGKPDFTVYENDKPQQIRSFRQQDFPVAMGIVIDNSGSMREKREQVNKAAINLVRSSNPDDQVFVVNFNDEYYLDQDFTADIKKLQSALEHVETRGGTALYDAIIASADYLVKSPLQRKVLFVVTDGEDDASQSSLEQAIQKLAQENGPVVYT